MFVSDLYTAFNMGLRWVHTLAGIIWIGDLYFLDFVCVPLQRSPVDSQRDPTIPTSMRRLFWWLRWGAMISLLSGLLLFVANYLYTPGVGLGVTPLFADDHGITDRVTWILFGMTVATVMWFNVWFVVWPQNKVVLAGKSSVDSSLLSLRSTRAIRTNTLLSGPMLFAMLAPSHYSSISLQTWLFVVVIAVLVMQGLSMLSHTAN